MRRDVGVTLMVSLILTAVAQGARHSPPGKPKLTSCRSPEKETFTCWWEAGSDGGLPTTYSLFYRKENSETVYECPDYRTAGQNSCFFNKNDTSIWVNYNITVKATNALGSNFSDPVDVDVVYIVQPHTPENVTVGVLEDKEGPFLRVSWEPPRKADTRSGWITLIYELRVKLEEEDKWEEHRAGQQKMFNIFSLHSGGVYMVQVRCKPDHGFWSKWSLATYVQVPDYIPRERSIWILITIFSAFIFFILIWILNMKRSSVKHCLLPPVPGPKIKGFDKQLLKNGKSEEIFNAFMVQGFPPTSDCEDLLVECLEVYVNEEQELMLEGKDLQDGGLKSKSPSDSDSGRGSCDSHTLLMEKCSDAKEEGGRGSEGARQGTLQGQVAWESLEEGEDSQISEEADTPDSADGKVKTWPSVFSLLLHDPMSSDHHHHHHSALEMSKQHSVSDSVPPPASTSAPHHQLDEQGPGQGLGEICLAKKTQPQWPHLQAHSEFNIPSVERVREASSAASAGLQLPPSGSTEYVEVQKVNQENMLLLKPLSGAPGEHAAAQAPLRGPLSGEECAAQASLQGPLSGEEYSKVHGVNIDNVLLLQRERTAKGCACHDQGGGADPASDSCYAASAAVTAQLPGKTAVLAPATITQEGVLLTPSGYVDAAAMLPSY